MRGDTLLMTMLFDFFGDLLTDKQREYFDLYHNEDLSLSEIAEKAGISRQGVFDIISRAEKTLLQFEEKTGVVRRFAELQEQIENAQKLAEKLRPSVTDESSLDIFENLVSTLTEMKG